VFNKYKYISSKVREVKYEAPIYRKYRYLYRYRKLPYS